MIAGYIGGMVGAAHDPSEPFEPTTKTLGLSILGWAELGNDAGMRK